MSWWVDYQTRRGIDRKTLLTNNFKHIVSTEFKNSTSYELVKINNVNRDVRIVEESSLVKNPNKKRLLCFPDETIGIGDIVEYDSSKWICTEKDTTSKVSDVGLITRCNNELKLYKSGILYQYPCIFSSDVRLTNMGLVDTQYLSQLKGERIAFIPNNTIGSLIEVGDKFKIGKWNYECIFSDDLLMPGLLVLDLRLILEEQVIPETQPSYVLNGDTNIIVGITNTYEAIHYVDGNSILTEFDFSIITNGVPEDAYTLSTIDDTHASIKCNRYPYTIKLRATNKNETTSYVDLEIKLTSFF